MAEAKGEPRTTRRWIVAFAIAVIVPLPLKIYALNNAGYCTIACGDSIECLMGCEFGGPNGSGGGLSGGGGDPNCDSPSSLAECNYCCQQTYQDQMKTFCDILEGTVGYAACVLAAQRNLDTCLTQCGIDYT